MTALPEDIAPLPYAANYGARRVTSHPIKGYRPLRAVEDIIEDDDDAEELVWVRPTEVSAPSAAAVSVAFVLLGTVTVAGAALAAEIIVWMAGVFAAM